jgi:hypothetical protein
LHIVDHLAGRGTSKRREEDYFNRSLELKSAFKECLSGRSKVAVKVVDIFGNDTMKIIEISI